MGRHPDNLGQICPQAWVYKLEPHKDSTADGGMAHFFSICNPHPTVPDTWLPKVVGLEADMNNGAKGIQRNVLSKVALHKNVHDVCPICQ